MSKRRRSPRKRTSGLKDRKGTGLAAPPVAVLQRMIVADIDDGPVGLVNPEIVRQEGSETMFEECLGLPELSLEVPRDTRIDVVGEDARGHRVELELTGLLARVLQGEIDHLQERLICDYEPETDTGD